VLFVYMESKLQWLFVIAFVHVLSIFALAWENGNSGNRTRTRTPNNPNPNPNSNPNPKRSCTFFCLRCRPRYPPVPEAMAMELLERATSDGDGMLESHG
jgi:hypothetical protein